MRPRPESTSKLQRLDRLVSPADREPTGPVEGAGEAKAAEEASLAKTLTPQVPADATGSVLQSPASAAPSPRVAAGRQEESVEPAGDADHRLPWNKPGLPMEKIVRLTVEFDYATFLKLDWIVHNVPSMSKRKFIIGASKQAIENEVRRLRRKGIV